MWFGYDTPRPYLVHHSCAIQILPHMAFISHCICATKLQEKDKACQNEK